MNIQNQSNINFTARISPEVIHEVNVERYACKTHGKTSQNVKTKIEEIEHWGSPYSELVIAKNLYGKNCLGLKIPINTTTTGVWEIRNLPGRKILTNLLNLQEEHITSTEKSIRYLFKNYGSDIFCKMK
jgi:hypothetical protein